MVTQGAKAYYLSPIYFPFLAAGAVWLEAITARGWRPLAIVMGNARSEAENRADLEGPGRYREVELAAVTDCRHCMPFERGRQLFVCRDPDFSFREIWDGERFFY